MKERKDNGGLRKLCGCPRGKWTKCEHAWYFNFTHNKEHYRFSLDRVITRIVHDAKGKWRRDRATLGPAITDKTAAMAEADRLRTAIRAGTIMAQAQQPQAQLTLRQLADAYEERYVATDHAATAAEYRYALNAVCKVVLPRPTGGTAPLGAWPLDSIVTDTVMRLREARLPQGATAANRSVRQLRALFAWGIRLGYTDRTPFKLHGESIVSLPKEEPRSRRLQDGEEAKLLAACSPLLHARVVVAIESGMRLGEILSLQWVQVEGMTATGSGAEAVEWAARSELFLPFAKTKTRRDRRIPISRRLKAVLEMRRFDPAGQPHASAAYVFGNEVGERVAGHTRAWNAAVLQSHGHTPTYTGAKGKSKKPDKRGTRNLSPESRAALKAINLHFHDLRREAGSRWLDGGVNIGTVQRWLGHSNVSQTSSYLSGVQSSEHDAMRRYEERQEEFCNGFATEAGKRGILGRSSATADQGMLSKNAEGSNPTIQ